MGHLGLEPRTIRLKAEYSTIELVTRNVLLIVQKKLAIGQCSLDKIYNKISNRK